MIHIGDLMPLALAELLPEPPRIPEPEPEPDPIPEPEPDPQDRQDVLTFPWRPYR